MNKIIINFMTNAYKEVSCNNIFVQQEFTDINRLIGLAFANWCQGIEANKNGIVENKYLDKQNNYEVGLNHTLKKAMSLILSPQQDNEYLIYMILAGSLIIYPAEEHKLGKPKTIGRFFNYIVRKVLATKISLPEINSEAKNFIVNCIVVSSLYTPFSKIQKDFSPNFKLQLLFVGYYKKYQDQKRIWLEIVSFVSNYGHALDNRYIISKYIEIDKSKKGSEFALKINYNNIKH